MIDVTYRWRLEVEDSFQITGRGLIVVGAFEGTGQQGDVAQVDTGSAETSFRIERVHFEVLTKEREGRPALLLGKLDKSKVSIGSVVHSID